MKFSWPGLPEIRVDLEQARVGGAVLPSPPQISFAPYYPKVHFKNDAVNVKRDFVPFKHHLPHFNRVWREA